MFCTRKNTTDPTFGGECVFNGTHYSVEMEISLGFQESVFNDGIRSNVDVIVMNISSGKKITFSEMLPPYIKQYGFYEGDTPYRLAPETIVGMFGS